MSETAPALTNQTAAAPVRALKPQWGLFWVALALFFAWAGVLAWLYFRSRGSAA